MSHLIQHKIVYPDGSEEVIHHYGMFTHNSGGFAFYMKDQSICDNGVETGNCEYIFVSGSNVRKIIPLGDL